MHTKSKKTQKAKGGFSLVEVLIASAIISVSLVALAVTSQISLRVIEESVERTQAEFLAEEGIESVRILRDESWSSNIAPRTAGVSYYPSFSTSTNTWTLGATAPAPIDGVFLREVTFESVYRRNVDEDIVSSSSPQSKHVDPGTREVTARVFWGDKEVQMKTYIADFFEN